MSLNFSRFYFDFDDECRTACLEGLAFKDVETIEADEYEKELESQNISFLRVDF